MTMAERYEDDYIVPFEIGLQSSETILMWGLAVFFWIVSFVSMGMVLGWKLTLFGLLMYFAGLLLWLWILFLSFFILMKGWAVYIGSSGTGMVIFIITFIAVAILATGGLLVANFMSSVKIVNWMNQPMNTFLLVAGLGATLASVLHMGFANKDLIFIDK